MSDKLSASSPSKPHENSGRKWWIAMAGIFLLALGLRLPYMDEPPRDFWTVRQYYVPMLARAMYWEELPELPKWQQELGWAHKQAFQGREPPVMEWLAMPIYRAIGHFAIWPLRLTPMLSWMVGGIFLFLIVRRIHSSRAALLSALFFLLLPYGVTASRSLQPDSMMVMGLLVAIWSMLNYNDRPDWGTWGLCVAASGSAILVKPGISQFAVSAVYLALSIERLGWKGTLRDLRTYLFYFGAALPAGLYLVVAILRGAGPVGHFGWNFQPHLVFTLYFWKGWLGILARMFGFPALALAACSLLGLRSRLATALLLGFGLGYLAQCFFTVAATPTHDYWHLQVVPLVAAGVGLSMDRLLSFASFHPWALAKQCAIWGLAVLWSASSVRAIWDDAFKAKDMTYHEVAKEIGAAVEHSTRTIILDHDKGYPLMYLANIYGTEWPVTLAMQFGEAVGNAADRESLNLSARERFDQFYLGKGYEYFIVCRALDELDRQAGLRELLESRYPLSASGHRYMIFDLRESIQK
jgi:hypothetical protein